MNVIAGSPHLQRTMSRRCSAFPPRPTNDGGISNSSKVCKRQVQNSLPKLSPRTARRVSTVRPLHPAVFEELKRQHDRFSYTGPLTGHDGGVTALAFNRQT